MRITDSGSERNIVEFASEFDRKRERLMQRMSRLTRQEAEIVQESGFALADQVVTHALVSAGAKRLVIEDQSQPAKAGVREITLDRYGLKLGSSRAGLKVSASSVLKGWSNADMVQYVLDHEVPVDPADMPGAIQRAA